MTQKFFEQRSDESEVKARIAQKYFYAWANIIMPTARRNGGKIAYIDLYAGPGRYKDGSASTPLLILEHAVANPNMASMLVTLLNDQDANNTATLQGEIDKIPGIKSLKFAPVVQTSSVDEDAADYFVRTNLVPSFTFVDPFGYKGLSLKIINGVIKDWGCDCVFFFNYNRINAGISNPVVKSHMDALFTEERADKLRLEIASKAPALRKSLLLESLANEIKALGGRYVLPFTFKNSSGTRTSHKLIFVSKKFLGYKVMKDIMSKESSSEDQGVPSLIYSPADATMPLLFSLNRPIDKLYDDLKVSFAGETLSFQEVYERHSVDTPYVERNYRDVLNKIEEDEMISAFSSTGKRRGLTYPPHVKIKFPEV